MPNHTATAKSLRKNVKRTEWNSQAKARMRTLIKKVRVAIKDNNADAAQASLRDAVSALDTAAKKNVIHPNNAARKKARLMSQVAGLAKS